MMKSPNSRQEYSPYMGHNSNHILKNNRMLPNLRVLRHPSSLSGSSSSCGENLSEYSKSSHSGPAAAADTTASKAPLLLQVELQP